MRLIFLPLHPEPRSAGLHFVNALHDNPPSTCNFGGDGWSDDRNLLAAVSNYTTRLVAGEGYVVGLALSVHFGRVQAY